MIWCDSMRLAQTAIVSTIRFAVFGIRYSVFGIRYSVFGIRLILRSWPHWLVQPELGPWSQAHCDERLGIKPYRLAITTAGIFSLNMKSANTTTAARESVQNHSLG